MGKKKKPYQWHREFFDPFKKECEFRYKENLYQALLK
ncbi:Hypothetical protein HPV225_0530 [Helicobacter pylori v225d]|nr:Hypothetical protein HPV225_0530 [Helicobacter pylori v225d]